MTLTAVAAAQHGTVQLVNGQAQYTPDAGYVGADQFGYTITDGNGGTAGGISYLTVAPTPVFSNLSSSSSITQGTTSVSFSGTISAGTLIPPSTEVVAVTLDGVTQNTAIDSQGNFSTSFNTSQLPASATPYQVTYAYSGDANFNSVSDDTATTLTVQAVPTTTVTSSTNPSVFGQSVTFTATLAWNGINSVLPTGTVQFIVDGIAYGALVSLSGGSATIADATLSGGTHTIMASYSGDSNFLGNTSPLITQTINQSGTATTLTASATTILFGQSVTFSSTVTAVTPGVGTPTGTVTFKEGATIVGTALLTNGSASFTSSTLPVSTGVVTAIYSGDTNFLTGTSPGLTETVARAGTATSLTLSASTVTIGDTVTLTATVSVQGLGQGTPTGTITFTDNGSFLATSLLSSGSASLTTTNLPVGSDAIIATYSGDANFSASTSSTVTEVVDKAVTTTTVTASLAQTVFTQPLTFTVTIGFTVGNASTPGGVVTLMDGSNVLAIAKVTGGNATYTTSMLPAGTHTITGIYGGDANFSPSTATAISQSVQLAVTSTAVNSSVDPAVIGQTVVFTATVTVASPSTGAAPGIVTFLDQGITLAIGALNGGMATLATTSLALGNHPITVLFGGDSNYSSSISIVLTQTVNQASTATKLTSSPNPGIYSQGVTFTATVTVNSPGSGTPTGTVTFLFGGALAPATGVLNGGVARFTSSTLPWGFSSVQVVYSGDPNFIASTSAPLTQTTVQTSFTILTASPNPSLSGQPTIFTATVSGGFSTPTGTVTFLKGTSLLATATLDNNGLATYACTGLTSAGSPYTVTAVYGGDSGSMGSTSAVLPQTVSQSSSSAVLASSLNPSALNQTVVLTATVAVTPPGQGTPTGTVTLLDGTTPLATALLSGGTASFRIGSLALSSHALTVSYSGDVNTAASTSAPMSQVVNAYALNNGILTIYGTPTNDSFSIAATTSQYTLNGTTYTFDPTALTEVQFLGNGGTDTATVTGASTGDTATLNPVSLQLLNAGYQIDVSNVANISVGSTGASNDVAYLHDGGGNSVFNGRPTDSLVVGNGSMNQVIGFKTVYAIGTPGGHDIAYFADNGGTNVFHGTPTHSWLTGSNYLVDVVNVVGAYATAGAGSMDTAFLNDAGGNNVFSATPSCSLLDGNGFRNYVQGYSTVCATAGAGSNDTAFLTDGGGYNVFNGTPTSSWLTSNGSLSKAINFRSVYAAAGTGSYDIAYLTDARGQNTFNGTPACSWFDGNGFPKPCQRLQSRLRDRQCRQQ